MDLKRCDNKQCERWTMLAVGYCCVPCRRSAEGDAPFDGTRPYMIEHNEPRCSERQAEWDAIRPTWAVRRHYVRLATAKGGAR